MCVGGLVGGSVSCEVGGHWGRLVGWPVSYDEGFRFPVAFDVSLSSLGVCLTCARHTSPGVCLMPLHGMRPAVCASHAPAWHEACCVCLTCPCMA